MWADPLFAAAYAEAGRFCGSSGIEVMEPLSFRGRRGSGLHGDTPRSGYRSDAARIWDADWEKYRQTYEVWGQALYGFEQFAETATGSPTRSLERPSFEAAIATASRILPLVTSAHCPSAANVHYWPEVYTMPPVSKQREGALSNVYRGDSTPPVRLGTISPIDPTIFSSAREFAVEFAEGRLGGRYSPLDVADWLEELAARTELNARDARDHVALDAADELCLRDAEAIAKIALYFARLFTTGVSYELFDLKGSREHLAAAVASLEEAISIWEALAKALDEVYIDDLAFGEVAEGRGSWRDRLPGMREELSQLRGELAVLSRTGSASSPTPSGAVRLPGVLERRLPPPLGSLQFDRPFRLGGAARVRLMLDESWAIENEIVAANFYCRHVNQFEPYAVVPMERDGLVAFQVDVAYEYLENGYAIQYFCEVEAEDSRKARLPGLGPALSGTPYQVFDQSRTAARWEQHDGAV
jgi:hypothetical protein